ncbi:MAG: ABC transporter ATP-binding protein [Methanosarcinales archaeon]|nr:ABC transporter ATP-binding protein [Methanosarcinales archaeon]
MSQPIIEVKNLSKQYHIGVDTTYKTLSESVTTTLRHPLQTLKNYNKQNEIFWALRDINFTVNRGEVVGIIGRNGAGKSTLLKVLSRITHPTEGEVLLRGRVGSLLEVGTGFHPELTGRENIYFNGAILGMKKREIDAKFDEIVQFAEIEKFLDTPVKRYSSGMYVRLAFAVAAHMDPEILLVDEVLAVGDAAFQKKCLGKMGEVAEGGRTVLFVSHNMASIKQLCSKAILLTNGIISYEDTPDETISFYMQYSIKKESNQTEYKHIKGNGRAQITKITVKNSSNTNGVSIFDDISILIDYSIIEPINELEFFLLIYSLDGEVLVSLFQRDSETFIKPIKENGTVSLQFINYLTPGKYLISAGIFDKSREFVDWVEHVESLYVEQSFNYGRNYDYRLGKMTISGIWAEIHEIKNKLS